jgi:hypothetical protein
MTECNIYNRRRNENSSTKGADLQMKRKKLKDRIVR